MDFVARIAAGFEDYIGEVSRYWAGSSMPVPNYPTSSGDAQMIVPAAPAIHIGQWGRAPSVLRT
ncbi:MAG: hypothetical protein ACOC1F_14070 [Myxococcota bacterium]